MALLLAALLPGSTVGQSNDGIKNADILFKWQLLEYRDPSAGPDAALVPVPPGISVTFFPFSGQIEVEGACSAYMTPYTFEPFYVQPPGEMTAVPCDAIAQAVDDAFTEAMTNASSLSPLDGDILTINDAIGDPLLRATRAGIPKDPTIASWELARIGDTDGSIRAVTINAPKMQFLLGGGSGEGLRGHVVGSTGCGSFLGSFETADTSMRISDVDFRLSQCPEELAAQARDFVTALSEITDFDVLPAGLALEDGSGNTRLALSPVVGLGNQTWTPTEVLGPDGMRVVFEAKNGKPLETADVLSLSAVKFRGGRTEGITYCGRPFEGGSITAGLALSTSNVSAIPQKKRCKPWRVAVEESFLDALRDTASFALRGGELELLDRDGIRRMSLAPQAALEGLTWELDYMDARPVDGTKYANVRETSATPITAEFRDLTNRVQGLTGAGGNEFFARYSTPGAAQIDIQKPDLSGRDCKGARNTTMCKRQEQYRLLLDQVSGYTVPGDELWLLDNGQLLLKFVLQAPVLVEE